MIDRKTVSYYRQIYQKGMRIKMLHMEDPYPIKKGDKGTIDFVDDAGMIHVKWDSGRSLTVSPVEDDFIV